MLAAISVASGQGEAGAGGRAAFGAAKALPATWAAASPSGAAARARRVILVILPSPSFRQLGREQAA
jgi:hypothetical protein